MNIKDHLNLIQNHGYKGKIAIYKGVDTLSTRKDSIVLVQNPRIKPNKWEDPEIEEWNKQQLETRTIEKPWSEEEIRSGKHGGCKTHSCCILVPLRLLDFIEL